MGRATNLTSKGQFTIPKEVRDDLHLRPGDGIQLVKNEQGHYEIHKLRPVKSPFTEWRGFLKKRVKARDIDRMIDEMRGR
jgi:AbrB family looped-hinge helix DNA binding protein